MVLSTDELNRYYGRPKTFAPVQVQARLPWIPRRSDGRVQVVLAHPLVADEFVAACRAAAKASGWVPQRIDSYAPRAIRGVDTSGGWRLGDKGTSRHSWAVAFDIFATRADVPPPGGVWTPDNGVPEEFGQAFEARGWTWGKRWRRVDVPHIEWSAPPPKRERDGLVDWLTGLLKQGDTGDEVWALQFNIRAAGVRLWPTGVFDSATAGAVRAVQESAGITVDGIAGPQTEQALNGMVAARHGSVEALVAAAYRDVLGRDPDADGASFWQGKIRGGVGVHSLWRELWESGEARYRRGQNVDELQAQYEEAVKALTGARASAASWRDRAEASERQLELVRGSLADLQSRAGQARNLVEDAAEMLAP